MQKQTVTRRGLLQVTAMGAGAAVASGLLGQERALASYGTVPRLAGKTAVVIGSGFGGAVAAYRLGQAGVRTTVLERGRRWAADGSGDTFCTVADPDWRCAWFGNRPPLGVDVSRRIERRAGLIDTHRGEGINVLSGTGIGGGSLVMGGLLAQPRRKDWTGVYPADLSYDEMDRVYWPRARRALGAAPMPADVQNHPRYQGARNWLETIAQFRQSAVAVPFGVDWDVIRAELAGRAPVCHTIGEGPFGSNSGALNSLDRNYLASATATGNVTVRALHEVTELHEVSGQHRFEVRFRQLNEYGDVLATSSVTCDYLFLAAGSVHTTSLLVTARAKGWLPRLCPAVGRGCGNNGDFLVLRLNVRAGVGRGEPGSAIFFDDGNADAPAAMTIDPWPVPAALGVPATAHLVTSVAPERGEIRYDPATGSARVHWPYAELQTQADKTGRDLVTRLWRATASDKGRPFGGLPTYDRGIGSGLGSATTWHPLGGMVLGQAVDFGGRSVDYPNLYCVDGSVLPGSTCLASPALTITANAERCMDRFIAAHAGTTR